MSSYLSSLCVELFLSHRLISLTTIRIPFVICFILQTILYDYLSQLSLKRLIITISYAFIYQVLLFSLLLYVLCLFVFEFQDTTVSLFSLLLLFKSQRCLRKAS